MRLLLLCAAFAASMFAQDAKISTPPPVQPGLEKKELFFTPEEIEKLTLVSAQMEILKTRFKVEDLEAKYKEYQAELAPVAARQEAILKAKCQAVGVSEERMKTGGCGISLGVDATGKPINGQDGKPVPSKVWVVPEAPKEPLKLPAEKK